LLQGFELTVLGCVVQDHVDMRTTLGSNDATAATGVHDQGHADRNGQSSFSCAGCAGCVVVTFGLTAAKASAALVATRSVYQLVTRSAGP
jgi:hypothetical protein